MVSTREGITDFSSWFNPPYLPRIIHTQPYETYNIFKHQYKTRFLYFNYIHHIRQYIFVATIMMETKTSNFNTTWKLSRHKIDEKVSYKMPVFLYKYNFLANIVNYSIFYVFHIVCDIVATSKGIGIIIALSTQWKSILNYYL